MVGLSLCRCDLNNDVSETSRLLEPSHHCIRGMPSSGTPAQHNASSGTLTRYQEFFQDSVPCPSCRGHGRVPKELEGELIALIPMKDKRLKPRRTVLYVSVATMLCLAFAGVWIFLLLPRNVVVTNDRSLLQPLSLVVNLSENFVNFTVQNHYSFSNDNVWVVRLNGAQMTAMYDERVISVAQNRTAIVIPGRASRTYDITMVFVLSNDNDWGFLVRFCNSRWSWAHNLPITFELIANYTYLGHLQQTTMTTYQQVSCYNSSANIVY